MSSPAPDHGETHIYLGGNHFYIEDPAGRQQVQGQPNQDEGPSSNSPNALIRLAAPTALYDATEVEDPSRCHPGTRESVLERLRLLIDAPDVDRPLVWVHGRAAIGKSTIMRTLAERLDDDDRLLASFFFSKSDTARNSTRRFMTTIAYQIHRAFPELSTPAESSSPTPSSSFVLGQSLKSQLRDFIVKPFRRLGNVRAAKREMEPQAIIIDGLDECQSVAQRREAVSVLNQLAQTCPIPLTIIISSRETRDLITTFGSSPLVKRTRRECLDHDPTAEDEITQYFVESFDTIVATHHQGPHLPLTGGRWPSWGIIYRLVRRASGQFVFAAAVIGFVSSPRVNPDLRLQIILGSSNLLPGDDEPLQEINGLYMTIFRNVPDADLDDVLKLLGAFFVPMSRGGSWDTMGPNWRKTWVSPPVAHPSIIERLVGMDRRRCRELLLDVDSLITLPPVTNRLELSHHSVWEFLWDERRSQRFSLRPDVAFSFLLERFISLDFWSPYDLVNSYIFANVVFFLSHATASESLVLAIKKINLLSMEKRVLARVSREEGYDIATWFWNVDAFLLGLRQSAIQHLYEPLYSSFLLIAQRRLSPYLEHPELWLIMFLATRDTETQLPFLDTTFPAHHIPPHLVHLDRNNLGLVRYGRITNFPAFEEGRSPLEELIYNSLSKPEYGGICGSEGGIENVLRAMMRFALHREGPLPSFFTTGHLIRDALASAEVSRELADELAVFVGRFEDELSGADRVSIHGYISDAIAGRPRSNTMELFTPPAGFTYIPRIRMIVHGHFLNSILRESLRLNRLPSIMQDRKSLQALLRRSRDYTFLSTTIQLFLDAFEPEVGGSVLQDLKGFTETITTQPAHPDHFDGPMYA